MIRVMFVLHCEEEREVNKVNAENNRVPSLYEWLGGAEVLKVLMVKFYERMSADELLRPLFGEMPTDYPKHVADFVGEVMRGSQAHTASRRGHATILAHHFGRNISERQRRRWVILLLDSANEIGPPGDPEFRSGPGGVPGVGIATRSHEFETASGYAGGFGNAHAEVGGSARWTVCAG